MFVVKQLTNMRTHASDGAIQLTPYTNLSLEQCLDFLLDDELLEVTPKSLRLRKRQLDPIKRKREAKSNQGKTVVEQAYLIDSHCHLHDQDFFAPEKQTELLQKAVENQVQKIVCIGTDHQDSLNAAGFVSQNPNYQLFWSYGIHPSECEKARPVVDFSKLEKPPVAIGEVGLDYHYGRDARDAQIKLLEEMLDLANRSHLPLIFHVREAFDDFFAILDNFSNQKIRGVVHSFTDNKKNLKNLSIAVSILV